jgi:hypothetical protein
MSKKKERQLKKQEEREAKREEAINNGTAIRIKYEEKKKKPAIPNSMSSLGTVAEEKEERQNTMESALAVYRKMLPVLLKKLGEIRDIRQGGKVKYKIRVLMVYGILMFVYKAASRREVNREITMPIFKKNLMMMFPELTEMPHADTLYRLLKDIEVEKIEEAMIELLKYLIRTKKFRNHLVNRRYLIAIDGTQKLYRGYKWADECLERHVGSNKIPQYYVYVLEAVLVLDNGIVLPLMSEILKNKEYFDSTEKQDCERKAFYRLAKRIKKTFPKLEIAVVMDGLYACGPVIRVCRKNNWSYMLTLKEESLKSVWREVTALIKLNPENSVEYQWGDRKQLYQWANEIEYMYGTNERLKEILNVVICDEYWEQINRITGKVEEMHTRYAWISDKKITENNVFRRCTKMARYRWKIENNILVEKHQGYVYEHCFSYNWNAMVGYHYLMKIGRFLNVLVVNSEILLNIVQKLGIEGFFRFIRLACSGDILDKERINKVINGGFLLRLIA